MEKSLGKRIDGVENIYNFVMAGKAWFALKSVKTGVVFQYQVNAAKQKHNNATTAWWVSTLITNTTNDMESPYRYIGGLYTRGVGKPWFHPNNFIKDLKVDTFVWFWDKLVKRELPKSLEFYHIGRCAKCGHKLTTEESIELGFGPTCWKRYISQFLNENEAVYQEAYTGTKSLEKTKQCWIVQWQYGGSWVNSSGTYRKTEKSAFLMLAECRATDQGTNYRLKSFRE